MLEGFYNLISSLESNQNGNHYESLTDEQKEELNLSIEESFDETNLMDHKKVKAKFSKWL